MEFDLVPQVIIIVASGVIIFILGRNIPKLKDDASDGFWSGNYNEVEKREKERFRYLYDRFIKKISKEEYKKKIDQFWIWFEKILRKARINFLRLDNTIVSLLDKLREKNVEKIFDNDDSSKNGDVLISKNSDMPISEGKTFGEVRKFAWNDVKRDESVAKIEKKGIEAVVAAETSKNDIYEGSQDAVSSANSEISHENTEEVAENISEIVPNLGDEQKTNREKEYIDMILKNPLDVKAYWHLGTIYARRRNYKDAMECFRQITKIDPTYEKAKHKLSEILEKMKKSVKRGEDVEVKGEEKEIG